MLIILGGLPGTGKTTIAKQLTQQLNAVYLRIDTAEQALKNLKDTKDFIGPEGYLVCYALAEDNLHLGATVIADSVNPISLTRQDWQDVAKHANSDFIEIEIVCSDVEEHKKRIETRTADITGHCLPTWQDVLDRDYELWESRALIVDTAKHSIDRSVEIIMNSIKTRMSGISKE